ncbi:hypothetical protein KY285_036476 [Solanum tuberosum]|nr:hypothetical protein KY289_036681 [Solanum tuberosum]KAH0639890.1 hypothetical protein KY285_036476 [Solanum tuberosum]
MTEYIVENIKPGMTETLDKAWWMGNSTAPIAQTLWKQFASCAVHQLIRAKYPWLRIVPYHWVGMIDLLHNYKPNLYFHIVKWEALDEGWVKCNIYGTSKGNPGESSYGFFLRNSTGDLLYAEAQNIANKNNRVTSKNESKIGMEVLVHSEENYNKATWISLSLFQLCGRKRSRLVMAKEGKGEHLYEVSITIMEKKEKLIPLIANQYQYSSLRWRTWMTQKRRRVKLEMKGHGKIFSGGS